MIDKDIIKERNERRSDPAGRMQIGLDNGAVAYITGDGPESLSFDIVGEGGRLAIYADAIETWH